MASSSNAAELLQQKSWETGPEDHLVQERHLPEQQVRCPVDQFETSQIRVLRPPPPPGNSLS